jgi:hypothetical protein
VCSMELVAYSIFLRYETDIWGKRRCGVPDTELRFIYSAGDGSGFALVGTFYPLGTWPALPGNKFKLTTYWVTLTTCRVLQDQCQVNKLSNLCSVWRLLYFDLKLTKESKVVC